MPILNADKWCISKTTLLHDAMQRMEKEGETVLFILDNDKTLLGSLADSDIRRWILSGGTSKGIVFEVCHHNPVTVPEDYDISDVKTLMLNHNIEVIPVVSSLQTVTDIILWADVFRDEPSRTIEKLNYPTVIMAGGKGTRLDPFTKVLPKPLIPIGSKTIIETIIDNFQVYGMDTFYLTVNYKSKLLKAYFEELNPEYKVVFIEEKKPLGTAGSLKLIKDKINTQFFVSNCDILIDGDYSAMMNYHKDNNNLITLVASLKIFNIPYGVCNLDDNGFLTDIDEKPQVEVLANSGMYILNPEVLDYIPKDTFFHITDLIENVKKGGGKVGVFPIGEKAWIDIGEWEEYKKALKHFSF